MCRKLWYPMVSPTLPLKTRGNDNNLNKPIGFRSTLSSDKPRTKGYARSWCVTRVNYHDSYAHIGKPHICGAGSGKSRRTKVHQLWGLANYGGLQNPQIWECPREKPSKTNGLGMFGVSQIQETPNWNQASGKPQSFKLRRICRLSWKAAPSTGAVKSLIFSCNHWVMKTMAMMATMMAW